jgi:hypothetical protein
MVLRSLIYQKLGSNESLHFAGTHGRLATERGRHCAPLSLIVIHC